MAKKIDTDLVATMKEDLHAAWIKIQTRYPAERLYAFGLYTTEEASYFIPFACGVDGLRQAAEEYVRGGYSPDVETASATLKWGVVAGSPYHGKLPCRRTETELRKHPDIQTGGLSAVAAAREIRSRFDAAIAALRALDGEGLFGVGEDRRSLVLLIEAGDRSNQFLLKWAKKLNPPDVFQAYASQLVEPPIGRWSEYGTKKVNASGSLSATVDRGLLAVTDGYAIYVFDVVTTKQVFRRSIPNSMDASINDVAISRRGDRIGITSGDTRRKALLTILDGPGWKEQKDIRLPAVPRIMAGGPDGEWYAFGFDDNRIRVYGASEEALAVLEGHEDRPRALATSADGAFLASIDAKSGVRIWRTADWTLAHEIRDARGVDVCFDPAGTRLATVQWSLPAQPDPAAEVLKIWEFPSGRLLHEHRVDGRKFAVARFSPDGRQLACGLWSVGKNKGAQAVLIDVDDGRVLQRLRGLFEGYDDFMFLPARNAIAVGGGGGGFSCGTHRPLVLWELTAPEQRGGQAFACETPGT